MLQNIYGTVLLNNLGSILPVHFDGWMCLPSTVWPIDLTFIKMNFKLKKQYQKICRII